MPVCVPDRGFVSCLVAFIVLPLLILACVTITSRINFRGITHRFDLDTTPGAKINKCYCRRSLVQITQIDACRAIDIHCCI
jgi:hypothetical protein